MFTWAITFDICWPIYTVLTFSTLTHKLLNQVVQKAAKQTQCNPRITLLMPSYPYGQNHVNRRSDRTFHFSMLLSDTFCYADHHMKRRKLFDLPISLPSPLRITGFEPFPSATGQQRCGSWPGRVHLLPWSAGRLTSSAALAADTTSLSMTSGTVRVSSPHDVIHCDRRQQPYGNDVIVGPKVKYSSRRWGVTHNVYVKLREYFHMQKKKKKEERRRERERKKKKKKRQKKRQRERESESDKTDIFTFALVLSAFKRKLVIIIEYYCVMMYLSKTQKKSSCIVCVFSDLFPLCLCAYHCEWQIVNSFYIWKKQTNTQQTTATKQKLR